MQIFCIVEFADPILGKLGVSGSLQGVADRRTLQMFFKDDIASLAVINEKVDKPVHQSAGSKFISSNANVHRPDFIIMPGGAEYRGSRARMIQSPKFGSADEMLSDYSEKEKHTPAKTTSKTNKHRGQHQFS